jgi:hypothetical protein
MWPEQQYSVAARLSPDCRWLVLQSLTDAGTSKLTQPYLYKLFLDVFDADTGEKDGDDRGDILGLRRLASRRSHCSVKL